MKRKRDPGKRHQVKSVELRFHISPLICEDEQIHSAECIVIRALTLLQTVSESCAIRLVTFLSFFFR